MYNKKYLSILFWLSLFTTQIFYAQTANLRTPRATIFTHLDNLQNHNYHPDFSAVTIFDVSGKQATDKAIKLKYIFEGKGLIMDYTELPNNPDFMDSVHFPIPKHAYKPFPYRLPNVYLEKYNNKWYYSKKTIAEVDNIYKQIYPFGANIISNNVPEFFRFTIFGIALWQWLSLLLTIIFTYFLHILFKKIIYLILKITRKKFLSSTIEFLDDKLNKFSHPLSYIFGIYVMKMIVPSLLLGQKLGGWLISSLKFAEIIFWIFVFLKLVDVFIEILKHKSKKTESRLDDQLIPIIQNTLKGIIIIFGIFKILIIMGADPKAIIAGASIGGLAIGLAAQDTVKNLIGTLMIFLDKPFKIGDWIEIDGVEGSVEEVGFRSSMIRAADTSIYKIPNSKLSEIAVNNKGKRIYRRYTTQLGLRYDTPPELIEVFVEGIKKIIELHPTTRNYSNYTPYNSVPYNVEFIGYGDFSLNILLNVYFVTHDYGEEMHGRHVLLLGILELANRIGVGFAFPSQTLFMESFPEKTPDFPKYNTAPENVNKAIKEVLEEFKNKIVNY